MKKIWILALLAGLLAGCQNEDEVPRNYDRNDYPNVFSAKANPDKEGQPQSLIFDQGSWYGFALSDDNNTGFAGPFSLNSNKWLSEKVMALNIRESETEPVVDSLQNSFYPGLLEQRFFFRDFTLTQKLFYVSGHTVLGYSEIKNTSSQPISLQTEFSGASKKALMVVPEEQHLSIIDSHDSLYVSFSREKQDLTITKNSYSFGNQNFRLQPNEKKAFIHTFSFNQIPVKTFDIEDYERLLAENETRWNNYLNDALAVDNYMNNDSSMKIIGVKSVTTLIHNWRKARKDLLHDGLFPSYAYAGFHGFWAWDSWKHAVALASFHPELAKAQVKAMFDYQNKNGMVADCIYPDKEENNWRNTKPPLSGWAVYKVYDYTKDADFLKDLYPKVKKYHEWWYQHRDHDKDSLCEYGSTDGTLLAAKWESGMDNAVRFDKAELLRNGENAYSLNQESVDLNSYLYLEKMHLANMAWILNYEEDAVQFEEEAKSLKKKIAEKFYFDDDKYYYDIHIDSDTAIRIKGPEAWIPLYAQISGHRTRKMIGHTLFSPNHFNTYVPFPTLSASHEKFNPEKGYWRGPVWLDQAYFAIQGMRMTGLWDESNEMFKKLLNNTSGLKGERPVYENYHPESGEGLNAPHFSWSAAHLLMLHRDEL